MHSGQGISRLHLQGKWFCAGRLGGASVSVSLTLHSGVISIAGPKCRLNVARENHSVFCCFVIGGGGREGSKIGGLT